MTPLDIAILGAGPIGLEAALYARSLGHSVTVLEKGQIAENLRLWSFVRMFSPWPMNISPLALRTLKLRELPHDECPTGRELRDQVLIPLAEHPLLSGAVFTQTRVLALGREDFLKHDEIGGERRNLSPFRILTRDSHRREQIVRADVVLDCGGTYGHHRFGGRGGIPAPGELSLSNRIHYLIPDVLGENRREFAGRHTLIIGSGYSAATVIRDLADLAPKNPGTRVSWALRRPGQALRQSSQDPLPGRAALVSSIQSLISSPPSWFQFLGSAAMETIDADRNGFVVTLFSDGMTISILADQVVSLCGYHPDNAIYEQLQVHQCYATGGPIGVSAAILGQTDCLSAGQSLTGESMRNPEPNFFILGAKSYGTNSAFLLQRGHDQIRDVFRLIQNDPQLDLYGA
jgi:Pyridine nucleotide-disulphide oxidoreductase